MKKLVLSLILIMVTVIVYPQLTVRSLKVDRLMHSDTSSMLIKTSKQDRFVFYLNGDIWETVITRKSNVSVRMSVSMDGRVSTWIQILSLPELTAKKLLEYIDSDPYIAVAGITTEAPTGLGKYTLSSFGIVFCDKRTDLIPLSNTNIEVDLFYLLHQVRKFFYPEGEWKLIYDGSLNVKI
jgi:hypothetical protein